MSKRDGPDLFEIVFKGFFAVIGALFAAIFFAEIWALALHLSGRLP